MIAIPAVDLRDGACVQLVGGSYDDERVRIDDPLAVAESWAAMGFARLHVVDLDAATGAGTNADLVRDILRRVPARISVGGGVRSEDHIAELLDLGAAHVVVGTRALEDPAWLARQAARFPARLIVAADVRDGRLATRGWRGAIDRDVVAAIRELSAFPLAALLVTAIDVEGTLGGPALDLISQATRASAKPIIASGGVGSIDDLRALERTGASAAVIGMALYAGALNPQTLIGEFAA
jgi:phosphoribosylformimino-5-aminoimidazole carboxamide ribotide isomerase